MRRWSRWGWAMNDLYEAVIGDDIEACWWGHGVDPRLTVEAAVMGFLADVWQPGADGDYTVTVYRNPITEDRDGDAHVIAWDDRGTCTASIRDDTDWSVGRITWDGLPVMPMPKGLTAAPAADPAANRALLQTITEARDLAHKLAISRGIAGTKGETALLDVRDLLARALGGGR